MEPRSVTEILVREAQSGRYQRFSEVYSRIAPAVCAWAQSTIPRPLQSRLTPDDLCQEVWVRAMRNIQNFDEAKGRFRQWIFGFSRRVLSEAIRASTRETQAQQLGSAFDLGEVPAEVSTVSSRAMRSEAKQQLLNALETLGDEDRRLVRLRGIEGRDHAEVAAEFGIGVSALRKRWQRLRDRMVELPGVSDLLASD